MLHVLIQYVKKSVHPFYSESYILCRVLLSLMKDHPIEENVLKNEQKKYFRTKTEKNTYENALAFLVPKM